MLVSVCVISYGGRRRRPLFFFFFFVVFFLFSRLIPETALVTVRNNERPNASAHAVEGGSSTCTYGAHSFPLILMKS